MVFLDVCFAYFSDSQSSPGRGPGRSHYFRDKRHGARAGFCRVPQELRVQGIEGVRRGQGGFSFFNGVLVLRLFFGVCAGGGWYFVLEAPPCCGNLVLMFLPSLVKLPRISYEPSLSTVVTKINPARALDPRVRQPVDKTD